MARKWVVRWATSLPWMSFLTGDHKMLEQAYGPMVIRFFILQAHYRSTLDFSNEALQASEKGLMRLMNAMDKLDTHSAIPSGYGGCGDLAEHCDRAMEDDMNTARLVGHLFERDTR